MRIEHQSPAPDLAFKVIAPLRVQTPDGVTLTAGAWTLSDIELDAPDLADQSVDLIVPFQGVDLQFPVVLEATAHQGTYSLKNLTGRQREIMALFYRGILSGRMASGEEMITSLDTPVDLVPMDQSEAETKPAAPKALRVAKVLTNLTLYSVLALVMVLTAGSLVWDRLTTVSLQHARVVAPVVPHLVATPGYVTDILVRPGDTVAQGQRLVAVSLPEGDARVEDIRSLRAELEDKVVDLQRRRIALIDRQIIEQRILEQRYKSLAALRSLRDFMGGYDLRPTVVAYLRWQAAITSVDDAALRRIDDQIEDTQDDLSRVRRDLRIAKESAGAADIFASVSGTVQEIQVFENQYLHRSQMAVIVEEDTERTIQAWLPEDRLSAIHPGMPVKVEVMGLGGRRSMTGTIATIAGSRDATVNDAFGLQIQISVPSKDLTENRGLLLADAPVTASALRPLGVAWARGIF